MVGMSMTAQIPDLPRVSRRHRNRALAQARKAKAIQLRTAGYTYQAIADQLGYANRPDRGIRGTSLHPSPGIRRGAGL